MNIEKNGLSLWTDTDDAPGIQESISRGLGFELTVAVSPISASNRLTLNFQINNTEVQSIQGQWNRNQNQKNIQYFNH